MTRRTSAEMEHLTGILMRVQEARMQQIVAEEARLRIALKELDAHAKDARALPAAQLHDMRSIGADLLWKGWLGRSRERLNIELAQVLARKGKALQQVRRAHGRSSAAQALAQEESKAFDEKRQAAGREEIQRLSVLQAWCVPDS